MFDNLVSLNSGAHRDLRYAPNQPYHFAARLMLCPVVVGEITRIAREYPIVFDRQAPIAQALLGSEEGVNAHVRDSGHWLGRYVPAHIRRYPFIAAEPQEQAAGNGGKDARRFALLIEPDAPHFNASRGERLFTPDGTPTNVLENVQTVLGNLQRDFERSRAVISALEAKELLVERAIRVDEKGGTSKQLTGFRLIDTRKLDALPADDLAALHKAGALLVAYAHIMSLTNLRDGVIAKRDYMPGGLDDDQLIFDA